MIRNIYSCYPVLLKLDRSQLALWIGKMSRLPTIKTTLSAAVSTKAEVPADTGYNVVGVSPPILKQEASRNDELYRTDSVYLLAAWHL
jgi:hypothetical protein